MNKWIVKYTIGGAELQTELNGPQKDEVAVKEHIEKTIPHSVFVSATPAK